MFELKPGDNITYRLPPSESPINPDKLWHGRVIRYSNGYVLIEVLEPGYEGLKEWIKDSLIVEVYHATILPTGATSTTNATIACIDIP